MKKYIYLSGVLFLLLMSCSKGNNEYGQGGENAIKYAIEQSDIELDNLENIEVTDADSMLTGLLYNEQEFKEKSDAFIENRISKEEFEVIVQEESNAMRDIYKLWRYGDNKDSLKSIGKYKDAWSLVYTITIIQKSMAHKNIRVIMEEDGITPKMTEDEFKAMMDKESVIAALVGKLNWNW